MSESCNTVCILTAGRGTRMGQIASQINKSLLPAGGVAVISRILKKFPKDFRFVIGLGHCAQMVKDYLRIAHPDLKFDFVEVDRFEGPGTGPGYSLLSCRSKLKEPFYFVSCDTIWEGEIDFKKKGNWFGVSSVPKEKRQQYCNFEVDDGKIVQIFDKREGDSQEPVSFTGLAQIWDHQLFWSGLSSTDQIAGEHQVSNGLSTLIKDSEVKALNVDWIDVGNQKNYQKYAQSFGEFDFSKSNEFLYLINGKVIKFFSDSKVGKNRVKRAQRRLEVFPKIVDQADHFFSYSFARGKTLYEDIDLAVFDQLLKWLETTVWRPVRVDQEKMRTVCSKFYFAKTHDRIESYYQKYGISDQESIVNEKKIPKTHELLSKVPWDELSDGIPVFFHGDLQFDNILYDRTKNRFCLIDWRQDFAGEIEFGDLYYDYAKLNGGMILNYDLIKKGQFSYSESQEGIHLNFSHRYLDLNFRQKLLSYVERRGHSSRRVELLTAIIFLNMSPLHHPPFDHLLYSLGRLKLLETLES